MFGNGQDSSVCKGVCFQDWQPVFEPLELDGRQRRPTPASYKLSSDLHTRAEAFPPMDTHRQM